MAAKTNSLEALRRKVKAALRKGLKAYGIQPKRIIAEPAVNGTKWRFLIISDDFEPWLFSERQDVIWRLLEKSLEADELLKVTMVMALTEKEAKGDFR
jgi:hypothetical protein